VWPPRRGIIPVSRHGPITGNVVNDCPFASSSFGNSGWPLGAQQQDPQIFDALITGEGLGDSCGHIFLRHQITCRCNSRSWAAVAGPTAAIRTPPIVPQVLKLFEKEIEERAHAIGLVNTSQS